MRTDTPAPRPVVTRSMPTADGIRDTIDSIILAFILSLVFRAFIAEAFIIPTGSMAPTLYGAHGDHRCSNCGYSFAYGIHEDRVRQPFGLTCPNCGNARDYLDGPRLPVLADSGDRILVLKWPFDIGGNLFGPQRWDVVVFKDPKDGKQNFIKRLIGTPGEVIELIDGDVYAAPARRLPDSLRSRLVADPLAGAGRALTADDFKALDRVLKIQRKTDAAQSALWQVHYDHDFLPADRQPDGAWWDAHGSTNQTGWDAATSIVTFDGRGDALHSLDLAGRPIADHYGYNPEMLHAGGLRQLRFVGDVRLRFVLSPEQFGGEIELLMSKHQDEFRLRIQADGQITLQRRDTDSRLRPRELATGRVEPLNAGRSRLIELTNVDYRVTLRVDGRIAVTTNDDDYHPEPGSLRKTPDGAGLPARVSIAAKGMPLTIRHLAVHRDVYYRSVPSENDAMHANPYFQKGVPGWGTSGNPICLRDSDYFVCGDNSPASKDSRLWWEDGDFVKRRGEAYQRGTVPGDQMIGRAFFVYWPSGHRLGEFGLPIIPNIGQMRLIR